MVLRRSRLGDEVNENEVDGACDKHFVEDT
jgi:hypothetical protein